MTTPHIDTKLGTIAPLVIMTGDPLRAKKMADIFLQNKQLVNKVRNILIYTGQYKGVAISIASSGIGHSSKAIYVQELYQFYDVQFILRLGSCGSLRTDLKLMDVVNVVASYSDFLYYEDFYSDHWSYPCFQIQNIIADTAQQLFTKPISNVKATADANFYSSRGKNEQAKNNIFQHDVVEMESYTLFVLAKMFNRHAGCLLTVSDQLQYQPQQEQYQNVKKLSPTQRQTAFIKAFQLGLEVLLKWQGAEKGG